MLDELKKWLGVSDLMRRVRRLENRMSRVDQAIADLNTATNDVADDLERLRQEVAGSDQATADRLAPVIERLRGLAVDPENPVPPVEPTP